MVNNLSNAGDLVKELKEIRMPDRLGLVCSTLIMLFSFFGTKIDTVMTFLFGASTFIFFFSMSLNRETHTEVRRVDNEVITNTEDKLWFTKYSKVSKWLFGFSALIFVLFITAVIKQIFL